jgi:PST family polysaccharide transporter
VTGAADAVEAERGPISRSAVQGAAWTALQLWGFNAGSFIVFVVLGRLLRPADFGVVAAALTATMLLRYVVDAGFTRHLVQRQELPLIYADTAFWTAVTFAACFTVLTFFLAPYFALLFGMPRLTDVIRALTPLFLLTALDVTQSGLLDRQMAFRLQAIRRLLATLVSGIVAISLAFAGAGVWALVAQQLVMEAVTVVMLWRLTTWRPQFRVSRDCLRELLPFGVRMTGIRVTDFATTNGDNLFVGTFFGAAALGYYSVAYRMFSVVNDVLVMMINRVALTTFSRLQDDEARLNNAFYRASRMASVLTLPACAGLALVSHELIETLFGPRWLASVPMLQLLTVAAFAFGQLTLCSSYVVARGGIRNEFRWTMFLAVVQVGAFAIAAQISVRAVAASVGIVLAVAWPLRLLLLRGLGSISLRSYFAHYPPLAATTLVAIAGVAAVQHAASGWPAGLALAAEAAVGLALFPLAARFLAPALVDEATRTVRELRGGGSTEPGVSS